MFGGLAGFSERGPRNGGSAMSLERFARLAALAEPGLAEKIERVGVHVYAANPAVVAARLVAAKRGLAAAGLSAPIALSETGWPTAGGAAAIPEEVRAAYLRELPAAVLSADCDVTALAPYAWITQQVNPSDPEHWFGLAEPGTAVPYRSGIEYGEAAVRLIAGEEVPAPSKSC